MESDNEIEIAREREDGGDENEELEDQQMDEDHGLDDKLSDNDNNDIKEEDESENGKELVNHDDQDEAEYDGMDKQDGAGREMITDGDDGFDDNDAVHDENEEDGEDEEPPILGLAPVVEINEELQAKSCNSEVMDEEAEEEIDESADISNVADVDDSMKIEAYDPDKLYVTKTQRDFIQRHRDIIQQINTKRCLCCNKEYPRRKAVIQHLQKIGHKVPKHTCYNCVITFGHIGALLSHMRANICTNLWKVIYNEEGVTDDMVIGNGPKGNKVQYKDIFNARSYACKLCNAKFQLKQFIMKHVLDVHEDGQSFVPLACVHCGARFKDKSLWKKHIRNGDCTVYIACDLCTEKFANMQSFNDHALEVHAGSFGQSDSQSKTIDGRPTDCPICGKKNTNYPNLVKHIRTIHNEDKPHFCQHCDAKFEQTSDLNKHIYMEHFDKTNTSQNSEPDMSIVKEEAEEYHYSCTECNAIFETVDAWTDHQVAEHNQVAHHCDQCEKKFLRPSELAEHKNTHLRVKFYPCSVCSNSYSTPQKLSDHVQQSHSGTVGVPTTDTEFFCELCIRSFKSRQAYSNHMRIHAKVPTTNRRPEPKGFTPQIIGKPINQFPITNSGFVYKPNCNVPNAPYSCDICGKGFMHKKNIWKHKKVLHADLISDRNDSEENTMHASTEDDEYNNDENGTQLSTPQFNSFNFSVFGGLSSAQQEPAQYSCELCFKKFPLRTSLWKHKRAKHGIVNINAGASEAQTQPGTSEGSGRSSCTICKITFADKKSYYRHRKNVHKSNVQMCKICGKPLGSTLELYEHLKAAHARELLGYNANQAGKQPESQPDEPEYEPEREPADPAAEYQARYPCDTCGKQFVGLLALQNHQCVNQSQQQTFDCEICHKSYTSIAALKSHRGWHLRSPDGKAAANNSGLWMPQHKVTNKVSKHEVVDASQLARVSLAPPSSSPVPTPAPAAPSKRRLPPEVEVTVVNPNKKMRSEDSESELAQPPAGPDDRYCTICDKEFTKRAAYQRHMDEVHQPNSVFCPVCDRSFTRKSTLLVHMRKHYGEEEGGPSAPPADDELHACDLCGAQYHSDKALRAHRARHHGEDSPDEDDAPLSASLPSATAPPGEFTCAQCGDGVATPRDLLAHRTVHATPSSFHCAVCKVYFARGPDLAAHTRARHSDNDKVFFPCAMCDRFYLNKKSLQRHIEMSH